MYDIDLTDIDFFIPFALHIDNMLVRIRQNVSVHNPLLHSIKAMSPIIYDIAVYISNLINHQGMCSCVRMRSPTLRFTSVHASRHL